MVATGAGFAGLTSFWPLAIVALVGTLNPSSSDVSVFLPLELARLAAAADTHLFVVHIDHHAPHHDRPRLPVQTQTPLESRPSRRLDIIYLNSNNSHYRIRFPGSGKAEPIFANQLQSLFGKVDREVRFWKRSIVTFDQSPFENCG